MKVKTYDNKTRAVLAILQGSPTPLAMPEISYLACMLGEYQEMEVRQIVWRLVSHNAVEMVAGTKFQSKGGCAEESPEWFAVMREKARVEEAEAKLKEALLKLVSN